MTALLVATSIIVIAGIIVLLAYSYLSKRQLDDLRESDPNLLPHKHVLLGAYQVIYDVAYDGREPGAYDQCVKCGEWVKREAVPYQHRKD